MWDVYGCLISGGWLKNVHLIQQFPLRDIEYRQTEVTFCWTAGQLWTHVKSTVWRTWHCWLQDFSGRAGFLADASDSRFLTTTCWAGWGWMGDVLCGNSSEDSGISGPAKSRDPRWQLPFLPLANAIICFLAPLQCGMTPIRGCSYI